MSTSAPSATVEPTTAEKIAKLPWSVASNAANTIFVQFTFFGSVFVLFLDELGLSKSQIGFLLSLIPYFGLIALFIAPRVAKFGYKRTFVTFFGVRKGITVFLLLTPLVLARFGPQTTLIFVSGVVMVFALSRSIAETARFPWVQEYVPNAVRGKYSATNNMFSTFLGFMAVTMAGFVIGRSTGLTGFMALMAVGVGAGLLSVWAASRIPGGRPSVEVQTKSTSPGDILRVAKDKNFLFYLLGSSFVILVITPLNSFVPLFMQEQVGLDSGQVILLQNGTLLGGLISTYLWGWAADRYGSKPVMMTGMAFTILLPIFWFIMPRQTTVSLAIALAIAVLKGIANMGWNIGSARLLFVSVVPPQQKTEYMALYYAWVGVVGGTSQLLGGRILDWSAAISGQFLLFVVDPFTPLFALGVILPLISLLLLRRVRADGRVSVGEFAGLFFRGNPFLAMGSLIGYHLAKDEETTVAMTERLGQTRSLLTVDELLEALQDPRFNVRFEAIISIARTRSDPRLTQALIEVLTGTELALTAVSAWALGRVGDQTAVEALRAGLDEPYRSIRAHCARALGTLGDKDSSPTLLTLLQDEDDKGLQMAYAATLGKLEAVEATAQLLHLLATMENEKARMSLALALARLAGDEGPFIRLLRQSRTDPGTTFSQAVSALRRKAGRTLPDDDPLLTAMTDCADKLARNQLDQGAALLGQLATSLGVQAPTESHRLILAACADHLATHEQARDAYLLLTLHTLDAAWPS